MLFYLFFAQPHTKIHTHKDMVLFSQKIYTYYKGTLLILMTNSVRLHFHSAIIIPLYTMCLYMQYMQLRFFAK